MSDITPKPPVSIGLGAVVVDRHGERWTQWNDWLFRSRSAPYEDRPYEDIEVDRILSRGVQEGDA